VLDALHVHRVFIVIYQLIRIQVEDDAMRLKSSYIFKSANMFKSANISGSAGTSGLNNISENYDIFKSTIMTKSAAICLLLTVLLILAPAHDAGTPWAQRKKSPYIISWEKQLNEMNYLIMRTSATNIIYGLNLSREQAVKLRRMAAIIDAAGAPVPDMRGSASPDLVRIRKTYRGLIRALIRKRPISAGLKREVTRMRMLESDIIRRSLLGARTGPRGAGCLQCHAPPRAFPRGDVSGTDTTVVSPEMRKQIDLAHVHGLFGKEGTVALWYLKSKVDKTLSGAQRFMLKNFSCCLIPPEHLARPTRIGQAVAAEDWLKFLRDIRKYSARDWRSVRPLYSYPLEHLFEAISPGITLRKKNAAVRRIEKVMEEARGMDSVDFELGKEALVSKIKKEIDIVARNTVESREQKEIRQFKAAMFLLLPGNTAIYDELLKRK